MANRGTHLLVVGVGNRYRRDDAVGPLVADRLAERGFRGVEASGEGAALIEAWNSEQTVVLIDAARSGAEPGTVHRFDAAAQVLPSGLFHYSSHQFAVAEAIELARALGRLPERLIVYGIEGADFAHGEGLTPAVEAAADALTERIAEEFADPCHEAKNPG